MEEEDLEEEVHVPIGPPIGSVWIFSSGVELIVTGSPQGQGGLLIPCQGSVWVNGTWNILRFDPKSRFAEDVYNLRRIL